MTVRHDGFAVDWLGYATVRIESPEGFVAYLDPGRYGVLTGDWSPDTEGVGHPPARDYREADGDLVCVTHDHHYDSDGIERVAGDDATLVVYEAVDAAGIDRDVSAVEDLPYDVERVAYGDSVTVGSASVEATPAYNEPDGPHTRSNGEPYHPEGFGCGFLLDVEGTSAFWTGDSDVVDAHREVDPSLFLPPIGGSFTMDRDGAADLAGALDPDLVLPIHYNTFDDLEADSGAFVTDVARRGVPVVLDER
jgi:L-ascorbate metabolism protein UlaG (beta-lactamase superfamily)